MVVGDDEPGRVDDEAGAGAHRFLPAAAEALAELPLERGAAQLGRYGDLGALLAGDGDVDHGGQHLLGEVGEVRDDDAAGSAEEAPLGAGRGDAAGQQQAGQT